MKIACSGSSGSGKTTLVHHIIKMCPELTHISGSAGDVKTEGDKMIIDEMFKYPGGGHVGVIRYSALNPEYGMMNQKLLQLRRSEIIHNNDSFITDRSPADNLTYMINQVSYHPSVTDAMTEEFAKDCLKAWEQLTHVIYVKAVQPGEIERNGSRVANRWYQKAIDCQFEFWINWLQDNCLEGPEVLIIDVWDWDKRVAMVQEFLNK
jgi:energy-coupling factor transporter ATP-binding protein EcfA2